MKAALLLLFLSAFPVFGETLYVTQSGAGTADGSTLGNAWSMASLNTSGNWGVGAGKVSAGDTIHLSGTITTALTVQGSGDVDSPVTIDFLAGANFSKTVWATTGALNWDNKDWLVIDGKGVGIIENTDNGTSLGSHVNSNGIVGTQSSHITVKDLTIRGMYVSNPAVPDDNRFGYCMVLNGTYVSVSGCTLSDGDGLLSFGGPSPGDRFTVVDDVRFINNTFNDFNHGLNLGIGNSSASGQNVTWNGLTISGNYFGRSTTWDNSSDHHVDDIIFFTNSFDPTIRMDGLHIYRNTFSAAYSTVNTAAVFLAHYNSEDQLSNVYIHNNLFLSSATSWGNGSIQGHANPCWVFNNTLWSPDGTKGGGIQTGGNTCRVYNNLNNTGTGGTFRAFSDDSVTDDDTLSQAATVLTTYFPDIFIDYNCYPNSDSKFQWGLAQKTHNADSWLSGLLNSAGQWQAWSPSNSTIAAFSLVHADPHSNTSTPSFNVGTYVPAPGDTACRGAGKNLTGLFPSGIQAAHPEVLQDFYGNPRASTGAWTIGAFEGGPRGSITATTATVGTLNGP